MRLWKEMSHNERIFAVLRTFRDGKPKPAKDILREVGVRDISLRKFVSWLERHMRFKYLRKEAVHDRSGNLMHVWIPDKTANVLGGVKKTEKNKNNQVKRQDIIRQSKIARKKYSEIERTYRLLQEQIRKGKVRMRLDRIIEVLTRYPESQVAMRIQKAVADGKAKLMILSNEG